MNFCSAFNPSRIVPPPGSSRSSGQLLSARGPSEASVSVRDGQDCSVLFDETKEAESSNGILLVLHCWLRNEFPGPLDRIDKKVEYVRLSLIGPR